MLKLDRLGQPRCDTAMIACRRQIQMQDPGKVTAGLLAMFAAGNIEEFRTDIVNVIDAVR